MSKAEVCLRAGALFLLLAATAVSLPAQTFTSLHNFDIRHGAYPWAPLIQGIDGNFYGTTQIGGAFTFTCSGGCGTIFKITPTGTLTTVHNFDGIHGSGADGGLAQDIHGNFYGVTNGGGTSGLGTIFKMTPRGQFTTLYNFAGFTGYGPQGGLVLAADGNFYGTASGGGPAAGVCHSAGPAAGCGTIFKITPGGRFTLLYTFGGIPDGGLPLGVLVQAPNGNLYGTASTLGTQNNYGTVFSITTTGKFTLVHQFDYTDGGYPFAGLVLGTDGNFYGQTDLGGASPYGAFGTVYKMTPSGQVTTLHSFEQTDGDNPISNLVEGPDGNFYGTASYGGLYPNFGTIFQITPTGTFTTLHNFDSTDGSYPYAGLIQASDGKFYAETYGGGTFSTVCWFGCGTVYSLSMGFGPLVETVPVAGKFGAAVDVLGTDLTGATSVTFNGVAAIFTIKSPTEITTQVPTGATSGTLTVMSPRGTLNSKAVFSVIP
jgi:uncharacterized repeat protein (TIGR03803 family)